MGFSLTFRCALPEAKRNAAQQPAAAPFLSFLLFLVENEQRTAS